MDVECATLVMTGVVYNTIMAFVSEIRTRNLSLNGTPQELTVYDSEANRKNSLSVQNTHPTAMVYIGTSSVSSTNFGHKLFPKQSFSIDLNPLDRIYAVGETGATVAVFIQEQI